MEIQLALSFSNEDKIGTINPHDDALAVTFRIRRYDVKRVMVGQGSGAEIMYHDLYRGLNLKLEDLTTYDSPLVSFDGKVVILRGQIRLPVQAGSEVVEVDFIVVDAYYSYTAIMARPWFHALRAVSSSGDQIEELVGNAVLEEAKCERLEEISIDGDSERFFQIGAQLPPREKEELLAFLRRNIDVFSWNAHKAPRVDSDFIFHHLNVNPIVLPRKQLPRCSSKEHFDVVREEVNKLK
ncbi:uncharacterized protein LOC112022297 [Quercus suber]|uniref:uncharacterized protein LOC112022297 n=1 Tax=Quercus suber TaxID=58331 RepID=UPI000CE27200|nr:uncharacterized protein LOC112022297 [Quercus suber]